MGRGDNQSASRLKIIQLFADRATTTIELREMIHYDFRRGLKNHPLVLPK
jgi:hypothetical protein